MVGVTEFDTPFCCLGCLLILYHKKRRTSTIPSTIPPRTPPAIAPVLLLDALPVGPGFMEDDPDPDTDGIVVGLELVDVGIDPVPFWTTRKSSVNGVVFSFPRNTTVMLCCPTGSLGVSKNFWLYLSTEPEGSPWRGKVTGFCPSIEYDPVAAAPGNSFRMKPYQARETPSKSADKCVADSERTWKLKHISP